MFSQLEAYIHHFVQPSPVQMSTFIDLLEVEQFSKNEYLLHAGEVCNKMYFINQGIIRHFYVNQGIEGTVWFSFANDLVTEVMSFIEQKPSFHNIITITDVELLSITHEKLQMLYQADPIWERFGRLSTERYLIGQIERGYSLLFKSGKEKYEDFISKSPEILQNIPLHQIASYIGVSFETLSRIRAKRN
ncbi:MAG: Crp/Fnr family transcriptional regulator [Thermoflexibacter sp.]|nr:Crp/Fnr family transcriptional regulator [Thermoflexibacter sp.]